MKRSTVVAGLLAAQVAVLGLIVMSVRGGSPMPAFAQHPSSGTLAGSHLIEGGPHQILDARAHLTVDIGYADVTFLPSKTAQIDVSLSPTTSPGLFEANGPITVDADGGSIHIAAVHAQDWSMGDDRMLTVLVPADTQVTVLAAGDIKANGLRAEASFKSVGHGSITVDDYRSPNLRVITSDGRISLNDVVATRLDATGGDGRVEGTALQVRDGDVESDGRVRLGFAAGTDTRVTAQTGDGKINVSGLRGESAGSTATQSDTGDDDDASSRTVRIGNGDGHLNVHSSDGNITLAQDG